MTLTLRELLQQNPVLTILGIIVIAIVLWRIVRGKSGDKPAVTEIAQAMPAVSADAKVRDGDIVAAITAAVNEHRKKE